MRNIKSLLIFLLVSIIGGGLLFCINLKMSTQTRIWVFIPAVLIFVINQILQKKLTNQKHWLIIATNIIIIGYVGFIIAYSFSKILLWYFAD